MAAGELAQEVRGLTPERPQPVAAAVPWPVIAENTLNVSGSAQQPPGSVIGRPEKFALGWMSA